MCDSVIDRARARHVWGCGVRCACSLPAPRPAWRLRAALVDVRTHLLQRVADQAVSAGGPLAPVRSAARSARYMTCQAVIFGSRASEAARRRAGRRGRSAPLFATSLAWAPGQARCSERWDGAWSTSWCAVSADAHCRVRSRSNRRRPSCPMELRKTMNLLCISACPIFI